MVFEEVVALSMPFDEALERTKAALAEQGFGTLTEIDMQATMRAKIDKAMDRYVIVGACNPHLASQALDAEPQIGVLLPCNVVVREAGGQVLVEAMDPGLMATMVDSDDIGPVADEARRLINAVLATLTAAT
jgi:uncharacterized protein (DUF302 family)